MRNSRETRPLAFGAIFYAILFPFFVAAGSTDGGIHFVPKETAAGRSPALFTNPTKPDKCLYAGLINAKSVDKSATDTNPSKAIPSDTPVQMRTAGLTQRSFDLIKPEKDTLHPQAFGPDSASLLPFSRGIGHAGNKDSLKPLLAIPQKKEPQQPSSSGHRALSSVNPTLQCDEKFLVRLLIVLLSIAVIGCFVLYAKNRTDKKAFVTKTRLSIMDKEVQKACNYIEKNYRNSGLSVDTICKDLVTGKAFLEALFKQELGIEIDLFITHVRINRARMLLEHKPGIDAAIAASETGFLTTELFCSAFFMIVGVSFEHYKNLRTTHAR